MVTHIDFSEAIYATIQMHLHEEYHDIHSATTSRHSKIFYDNINRVAFTVRGGAMTKFHMSNDPKLNLWPYFNGTHFSPGIFEFSFVELKKQKGIVNNPRITPAGGISGTRWNEPPVKRAFSHVGFILDYIVDVNANPPSARIQFFKPNGGAAIFKQQVEALIPEKVSFHARLQSIHRIRMSIFDGPTFLRHLVFSDNHDQFNSVFENIEV
ncbi:MAG: hypothetical protein EON98_03105 [Chitinophagaceae bacterium]|nr:MAG: hypothetical protein EON98_03105 [Chitinophagaceae bacterium]